MTADEKREFREAFWKRAGRNLRAALEMIDTIPGACSYVKDADGRFVAANRRNCEICHVKDEESIVGLTSADIFPAPLARAYLALDRRVRESGEPVVAATDSPTGDYSTDRLVKSVYPVLAEDGACIGTMCVFVQTPSREQVPAWHGRIRALTAWIAENPGEEMTLEGLARRAKMTPRQLRDAFRGILGTSVTAFIAKQRLAAARRLLETTGKSVSDIAQECGYFDHSHFSKAFRAAYGKSPTAWRVSI
ncbi:MAG: helix-turn-helix domain-containing protein [Kiritimatiellae bacterium]|nr:helix-turn-helix domain-containing protein [Kiritimatiellia bacterium]